MEKRVKFADLSESAQNLIREQLKKSGDKINEDDITVYPSDDKYSPQSGFRKCCLTLLKKKTGRFEAVIQICHCGIVQNLFVRKKSCLN